MPFLDLAREVGELRPALDGALARVLDSGRFVGGEEVERFERAFAGFCGASHAVGVASGTDAVSIALEAVGVRPGDEVITAANTCVPTVAGIEGARAVPVLVDVDPDTFTLAADRLEGALSSRTRAIVPVHLYGQCADMAPLVDFARAHGLRVVEDAAHAHGAEYEGRRAGTLGDAAAFSFFPTKNLGALGDGGAVVTSDPDVGERARLLRSYGEQERFTHVLKGRNSRLDALQAACLSAKLPFLEERNGRRRAIAARYDEALEGTDTQAPVEAEGRRHAYHLYVVRSPRRDELRARLAERRIETAVHYPLPIHHQPAYRDLVPAGRSLAASEALAAQIMSAPLHPSLTDEEAGYVAAALAESSR